MPPEEFFPVALTVGVSVLALTVGVSVLGVHLPKIIHREHRFAVAGRDSENEENSVE